MHTFKFHSTPLTLSFTYLVSTVAGIAYLWINPFTTFDLLYILIGWFLLAGVGIEVFYHRYISHTSFKTYRLVEILGYPFGILAGRGSPTEWAAVHRTHHKFADTDLDPHNPRKDTWRLFFPYRFLYTQHINPFIVKDLLKSNTQRFITKYYNLIIGVFAISLAFISLDVFFYLWVIPVALTGWFVALGTVFNHMYGYRNYQTNDKSSNSIIMAILLWGQGWHNNHHAQPTRWNLQEKWWEFDPSALVIRLIKR